MYTTTGKYVELLGVTGSLKARATGDGSTWCNM